MNETLQKAVVDFIEELTKALSLVNQLLEVMVEGETRHKRAGRRTT